MNTERLLKLAALLEVDADKTDGIKFNLETWGDATEGYVSHSCGTTACAVGLAIVSGAFKDEGLNNADEMDEPGEDGLRSVWPGFGDLQGWPAVRAFFDLDRSESEFLFDQDEYPEEYRTEAKGERYVAARIREFVAGKEIF